MRKHYANTVNHVIQSISMKPVSVLLADKFD